MFMWKKLLKIKFLKTGNEKFRILQPSTTKIFWAVALLVFSAMISYGQTTTTNPANPPVTTSTPITPATPNPQQQQPRPDTDVQRNSPPRSTTEQQQQTTQTQTPQQQPPQQQQPATVTPGQVQPNIINPNTANPAQVNANPAIQTPGQSVGSSGGAAPAVLPDDPPPIAPNFEAPIRPLPSAERVGVDIANQLPLTLQEAITLALQNNNDIDSSKIDVQIAEFNLKAARGVYDPVLASENYYERRTTPTASTIGGAAGTGSVTQSEITGGFNITGFSPRAGGAYQADFSSSRLNTNNQNATLNPQFPSVLTLTYTQPLWRGLRFDANRRTIEIAKKNLSLTDAQFRQKAIDVIAQVESSYWDLAFALRSLQVQIDAVKQARAQLESNQRLVAKGVLAPIDIIAANSQITTFEQSVYSAQEAVTRAENTLKTLMLPNRASDIWSRPLVPVSSIELEIPRAPLNESITAALANRQELRQIQTNAEINKINERYYRDQTKPQVDLVGVYTANGLAGTAIPRATNTSTSALTARVNQLSALEGLPPLDTTTTTAGSVSANLVGGYFKSLSNLITADYPTYRAGVRISLPLGNRTAEANLGRTLVEGNQITNQRAQQEQLIEADVRNTMQTLRSAESRLASAAASRASAEQLFESEQRQFRAGTSTVFLVLQRQNELVAARGRELQAQTDLNKSISDFQRATGTTLAANNVTVSNDTSLRLIPRFTPDVFSLKMFDSTRRAK